MSYEKFETVDLPHGTVIDLGLWDKVQQTVLKVKGLNDKNNTYVYVLSGLLQFIDDGSPFHGEGVTSKDTRYYTNKKHNIRLRLDMLESEARRVTQEIMQNSPSFQIALKRSMSPYVRIDVAS
jgi:hypothetical protein